MIPKPNFLKRRKYFSKSCESVFNNRNKRSQCSQTLTYDACEPRLLLANDPPVNLVPGVQYATENVPLAFSSYRGNLISTSDSDAGENPVKVTLSAEHGVITLVYPDPNEGLNYSLGDGVEDSVMTFTGNIRDINKALSWLAFVPDADYVGTEASVTITTNDQGYFGSGGPQEDTDTIPIEVEAVEFADSPTWTTLPAALDTTLNNDGRLTLSLSSGIDRINHMGVLPDGKILAVGAVNNHFGVIRFNSNLSLDTSFGTGGFAETDLGESNHASTYVVDRDGRIVVAGGGFVVRYNSNGTIDETFGGNGTTEINTFSAAQAIEIQANGKIVIAGDNNSGDNDLFQAIRLDANGSVDPSFYTSVNVGIYGGGRWKNDEVRGLTVREDGEIIISGKSYNFGNGNNEHRFAQVRTPIDGRISEGNGLDGELQFIVGDEIGGGNAGPWHEVGDAIVLRDGGWLLVGRANGQQTLTKHRHTGLLDTSFGENGQVSFDFATSASYAFAAATQSDGKMVVTGYVEDDGGRMSVARLLSNGELDPSFNGSGKLLVPIYEAGDSVIVLENGKIIVAGHVGNNIGLVRLYGDYNVFNEENEEPTLDFINDIIVDEDASTQVINLTGISAGEGEEQPLRVTATSDNVELIPNPAVTYNSPDSTGTLSFTPVAEQYGVATITTTVEDGGDDNDLTTTADNLSFSRTFQVTVNSVNDIPLISPIGDVTIDEDSSEQTVDLTGIFAGGGEEQNLRITAASDNVGLIPNPTVSYTSPNTTGSLAFTPVADRYGLATITVTVEDGGDDDDLATPEDNLSLSRTFQVTVNSVNDIPLIAPIGDVTIDEDSSEQTVDLTGIFAGGGEEQSLRITATSDNVGLIPNPTVSYTSPETTGGLSFTPVADQYGVATITVTVEDGGDDNDLATTEDNLSFSRTFDVTVNPVNDIPLLASIQDITLEEDTSEQVVNLTDIYAGGGEDQNLRITASSDNVGLIPNPTVTYTSPNTNGSLTLHPVENQSGDATITVTVEDGGDDNDLATTEDNLSFSRTFEVTVNPVNDAPTFEITKIGWSIIGDQTLDTGIDFTNVAISDLNSDGFDDFVLLRGFFSGNSNNQILVGSHSADIGSGKIERTIPLSTTPHFVGMGLGDSNDDGIQDVLLGKNHTGTGRGVFTYEGDGNYQFDYAEDISNGGYFTPIYISTHDFNNDGVNEIITSNYNNSSNGGVTVIFDDGTIRALRPWPNFSTNGYNLVIDDMNNDGFSDIVVPVGDPEMEGPTGLAVMLSDGGTNFTQSFVPLSNSQGQRYADAVDLDGDGAPEILVADTLNDSIHIYSNDGSGNFTPQTDQLTFPAASRVHVLKNPRMTDGTTVVAVTSESGGVGLFEYNSASESWRNIEEISASPSSSEVGDFNGDGTLDLVLLESQQLRFLYFTDAGLIFDETGQINLDEDALEQRVNLTGISSGASDETQPLRVTATSNNTGLIPNPTVTYASPETTGSLAFTPIADQHDVATFTVTVEDGGDDNDLATPEDNLSFSRTFEVTVNPVNDIPLLAPIDDITIGEDSSEQVVDLTGIFAGGGEEQNLRITATSDNVGLVPNPAVTYSSPETTGSLAFTPIADQSGVATITVTVEDGGDDNDLATTEDNLSFSRAFEVTVNPVNDIPLIAPIEDLTLEEDASEQIVNLSDIYAGGGEEQNLRITATSDNVGLIPNPAVNYTSSNTNGSLAFIPVADQYGVATITVTVEDGGDDNDLASTQDNLTFSRTFEVTVDRVDVVGQVDFYESSSESINGVYWLRGVAKNSGLLSFETTFDSNDGGLSMDLLDNTGTVVASGVSSANELRIDYPATAGEFFSLRTTGTNTSVDYRVVNLVSTSGRTVNITGTPAHDRFAFATGNFNRITAKGLSYFFRSSDFDEYNFDGGLGNDFIWLGGTSGVDTVDFRVGETTLVGAKGTINANSIRDIVFKGLGGDDVANFFDSPGIDTFVNDDGYGVFSGANFEHVARGVPVMNVYAAEGFDQAFVRDTDDDDTFESYPDRAVMTGGGVVISTYGFDATYGVSRSGSDTALMHDSAGDDQLISMSDRAIMSGDGYRNTAVEFTSYRSDSSGQPGDTAIVFDSERDDAFEGHGTYALMSFTEGESRIENFATVFATSTAGTDTVNLYDSEGDDTYIGYVDRASMEQPLNFTWVSGFASTVGHSNNGSDTALLFDSTGNDEFVSGSNESLMYYGGATVSTNQAIGFAQNYGFSESGDDIARLTDTLGKETYMGSPDRSVLRGDNMFSWVSGFSEVDVVSSGGSDIALLYDSEGDDEYRSEGASSHMIGPGYHNRTTGFLRNNGYASTGSDQASLYDTSFNDLYRVYDDRAIMRNSGTTEIVINSAYGFDRTRAYSTEGNDRAKMYDSIGDDTYSSIVGSARFTGDTFDNYTYGFRYNDAYSLNGNDLAVMEDSSGNDELLVRVQGLKMKYDNGVYYDVRAFDHYIANSFNGGEDNVIDVDPFEYLLELDGDWIT